ncbi:unnamed protein product [Rhizophagus irregularis]|nr:unnamed protein product [Rhizophagus irregularis]
MAEISNFSMKNLDIETASDNFIEDIIDKSQIIIKSLLSAIETTTDTSTLSQITLCTFQSLHCIQGFGIAFFTAKTAVNIALETNSDHELIQLLKDFIEAKQEKNVDNNDNVNHDIIEINESNQENDNIVLLQKNLIEQITSPYVTKVRGLHQKKRLRSAMEISKRRVLMQEIIDKSNVQPKVACRN